MLMTYTATLFLWSLIPRIGLSFKSEYSRKTLFWAFFCVFFIILTACCTLNGIFIGYSPCNRNPNCDHDTAPYVFMMIFSALLVDMTEQHIEVIALSRKHLNNDPLVYNSACKFMGYMVMFITQMSLQSAITYKYQDYFGANNQTQYQFTETIFILVLTAIPSSGGFGWFLEFWFKLCAKNKMPYDKAIGAKSYAALGSRNYEAF
jgi:magnesium-transporting ATPase (P-type)